jgi:hypothetical protein
LNNEPGYPAIQEEITDRKDDSDRRRDGNNVSQGNKDIVVGHQVVLRTVNIVGR